MRAFVLIPYYDRPKMVLNVFRSLMRQTDQNWHAAVVDDGSVVPVQPIVDDFFQGDERVRVFRCDDTVEQKKRQKGSRHGEFLNRAILECADPEDVVIVCCDDDALVDDCVENVLRWFGENADVWGYGHVHEYDPMAEEPGEVIRGSQLNRHEGSIDPVCAVDGSQVCYRASVFHEDGVRYPFPLTGALDAESFRQIGERHGKASCRWMGFVTQHKGVFAGQMGKRADMLQAVDKP